MKLVDHSAASRILTPFLSHCPPMPRTTIASPLTRLFTKEKLEWSLEA